MPKGISGNPNGRDVIPIEWKTVYNLCAIQCTGEEMAAILNISYDTLERAIQREHSMCFAEFYKKHSAKGKMSLRRTQFKMATENENVTMLIWLGKQYLGQTDQQQVMVGEYNQDDEFL